MLKYIETTWLKPWKESIVRAYADRYLHFGNRATSRVEGGHSILKRYLQISTGDLKHALEKINLMLTNQINEHQVAMAQAKDRTPQRFMVPFLSELIGHVTPFALHKIMDQHNLLTKPNLIVCHHSMRDSMGIPCHHQIAERLREKEGLHLSEIHERWHFIKPSGKVGPVATGQLLLLNPRVIKGKGRPKGSKTKHKAASSTKRDASAFEIETAAQHRVLRPRK